MCFVMRGRCGWKWKAIFALEEESQRVWLPAGHGLGGNVETTSVKFIP
jgi:hypothetical protein